MLEKYIKHIKNNHEGYWFKAKLYGWGWVPATWQGWLIMIFYVAIVLVLSFNIENNASDQDALFGFVIPLLTATILFIVIAYKKGEKPTWRWGPPKEEE